MIKDKIEHFYTKNYKILLFIPIVLLIISLGIVGTKYARTGDLFDKDVSLKGGITATIYTDKQINIEELKTAIGVDSEIKVLSDFVKAKQIGFVITVSDISSDDLQSKIENYLNIKLTQANYSVEETGPKLGQAFYKQLMFAVLFAFVLMGIAVFVTFRTPIPSLAVMLSAFIDIMIPLAIINLMGIKISTAGIVAFLLVIGYSVDTDILLTTWAIRKKHEGRLFDRMYHSMLTGLTMTACAIAVMITGIILTQSFVIKEMFIIIFIALLTDVLSTYLTNAAILTWYCEKKRNTISMTSKILKILKQWQVIFLIVVLVLCLITINPQFGNKGVIINSVEYNSSAYTAGITSPNSEISPTNRERVLKVSGNEIKTPEEFYNALDAIQPGQTFRISTDKQEYALIKSNESVGITVAEAPTSNLKKGLELQGGTRVLLKPIGQVNNQEIKDIMDTMSERLNVYGLTDLTIKSASDLEGNKYIVVEIAGATKEEVKELIAKQGKFEAKIGEELVFVGGNKDITFVCRNDGSCSRISNCQAMQDGYYCRFEFEIALSAEAADRHARITEGLSINLSSGGQRILSSTIDFYLDGKQVDRLQIDAGLKGQKATRVTISGPGYGRTIKEAQQTAIANKNKLQTILLTGSLPTQLEIVKLDTISPSLGKSFIDNILWIGAIATILVGLIIAVRYRKLKIIIPVMLTVLSEVFIILGFAALFKYNLDVAAIAAILASVGTGVDHQIVITDEIIYGARTDSSANIKARVKKAFFVIMAAAATAVAAMLPLLWAGAGLLTGFAIVTIAGVIIGVCITRPAFGATMRILMED